MRVFSIYKESEEIMTAIVAGQGLGLFNTSANVLGGDSGQIGVASQGRSGEKVAVNASTGNLVVQQQDEWLVGVGQDVGLLRTYNSLATGDGDNNDNWRLGLNRKINATSTGAASITRVSDDGAELTYTNVGGKFVNKDGSGSFDTITWDATNSQWIWEDGNTHVKEYYKASGTANEYRLVQITDAGNSTASVTINYDATSGLITSIKTAGGEVMELTYEAATVSGKKPHIKSVQLKSSSSAPTAYYKRVTYDYDAQDRLKKVWVDLSPEDSSTLDGKVYWTEYTYIDTTSNRLKTLKQSDDSQLEFHYDTSNRIDWIKETMVTGGAPEVRQTSFAYGTGNTTQITDASGNITELTYVNTAGASYGQIQSIKRPLSGANLPTVSFNYDGDGNVLNSTDARGNLTKYRYDTSGNCIFQEDAQGNITERTFSTVNQVLTETTYSNRDTDLDGGASGALTTRYLYDATYPTRLRFMISPEGRVTQYTYNTLGQRVSTIQYPASAYTGLVQDFGANTTGLTTSAAFVRASNQLQYTASTTTSTATISTTDTSALGTLWSMDVSTPAAGTGTDLLFLGLESGTSGTATFRRTRLRISGGQFYTEQQSGTSANAAVALGTAKAGTTYVVEFDTQADGSMTLYVYEKGKERSTAFKKVFAADAGWSAPKLYIQGNSGAGAIACTIAIDNLAAQWRPTLADMANWSNGLSDKTSWIRTDYLYDTLRGQLQSETTYASTDASGNGNLSAWNDASWLDNYTQYIYDQSGNLLQKIDSAKADAMLYSDNSWALEQRKRLGIVYTVAGPNGGVGEGKKVIDLTATDRTLITSKASFNTVFVYDGLNRVSKQTDAAGNVTLTTYDDANRTTKVELANGLTTTSTYDRSGGLIVRAQIDKAAPGISLGSTEYAYDKMGRLTSTKVSSTGERTFILYDALGRKVGDIDAEGALTEYQYNSEDQVTRTIAYANKVSSAVLAALALDPSAGTVPANLLTNTLSGWTATASNAAKITSGLNTGAANTSSTTTLTGDNTQWLKQIDGDATLTSQLQSGTITLPTTGSRRFEVSAYVGVVNATATLSVQFFNTLPNASTVPMSTIDTVSTSAKAGGANLSDYSRLATYVDAPAGALYARVVVKKSATASGQTSSLLYVTHPLIAQTAVSGTITKPFAALDVRPDASAIADRGSWNIYDKAGRLAKTITMRGEGNYSLDEIGQIVEYRYDGAGRLTDTIAYATPLYTNALSSAPGLVKLRSALSEIQAGDGTLTIDGTTYTLNLDAANDRRTRNFYSADGLLIGQLDAENFYTGNTYDSAGRLLSATRYGKAIATVVPEGNTPPVPVISFDMIAGLDRTTRYYYNGRGQLVGTLDGEFYYTAYQYDMGGNKMSQTRYANVAVNTVGTAAAPTIAASAPQGGGPYVLTNSEDHATKYFYDANNRVIRTQENPSGVVTTYDYDKVGKLTKTVVALGTGDERTAQKRYDAAGRVIFELGGVGSTKLAGLSDQTAIDNIWKTYGTQYLYDAGGRLTATITPDGSTATGLKTIYYYDKAGRVTHSINALGEIKQYTYNAFGEQSEVRQVATRVASATLAGLGGGLNTSLAAGTVVTGSSDSVISMLYSRDGQVRHAIDAENNVTDTWYTAFGQVLWSDPPQLNSTDRYFEYTYDRRGLVKQVSDIDVGNGAYSNTYSQYNAFGQLMSSTDARGKKTTYAYDKLGRSYAVTDAGTLNFGSATVYDAFNRVLTQTDRTAQNTTSYKYDSANRTVTITTAEGANANAALSFKTVQELNREGQIVSITDGRGAYTQYTYDADGHLSNTKVKNASTDADAAALTSESSTYDNAGRISTTTNAMGGVTTISYDKASRVLTQTQTDGLGNTFKVQYRYDALGRAVWKQDASGTWTQTTFDRNGRVKTVVVDPKNIPSGSQAADALDITLASNSAGLALTTQFDYDGQGHVVLLTEGVGSLQPKKTQYKYDLRGRRQFEIVDPDNLALTTEYVYDTNDNVVARLDTKNATTKQTTRYVYDDNNRLSWQIDAAGAVTQTEYDASGNVSRVTAYAKLIDLTASDLQNLQALTATIISGKVGAPNASIDHVTRYVYDTDNRLSFTIDSQGYGTRNEYDKAGNVVVKTRYAAKIPMLAGNPSLNIEGRVTFAVDTTTLATLADDSKDQVDQYIYDGAHRVIGHVDAQGGYTLTEYRKNNREIRTTRYVNAVVYPATPPAGTAKNRLVVNTAPATSSTAPVASSITVPTLLLSSGSTGKDVVSYQWLDALGQVSGTQDGAGYAVTYERDGMGRVLRTVDQSNNAMFNVYDRAGRQTLATDALGTITKTTYDAVGRVIKTSQIEGMLPPDMGASVGYGGKLARDLSQNMGNVNNGDTVTVTGYVKVDDGASALITLGNQAGTTQVTTTKAGVRDGDGAWQTFSLMYTHNSATPMPLWLTMNGDNNAAHAGMDSNIVYDDVYVNVTRSGASTNTQVFGDDYGNADVGAPLSGYTITGSVTRVQYEYLEGTSGAWLTLLANSSSATVTHVNSYTYDTAGRLIEETQAQGSTEQATTRYVLDKLGQREKVIDPRGVELAQGTSQWAKDQRLAILGTSNAPAFSTDPASDYQKLLARYTTTQTFDAQGHVTQTKDALDGTTNTQYDAFGNVVRIQDPNKNYGYFFFNELNQATWQVDPLGYATETRYNSLGQVDTIVKYAKPLKNWTAGATNPATPLNADGIAKYKATYGSTSWPTGAYVDVDALDASTTIGHDKLGRQTSIKDAMGFTESMSYDALGNKITFTAKSPTSTASDAGGTYQYEYDKRGLMVKETLPEVVKQYDTAGAVTSTNNVVYNKYEYDARGNKTKSIEAVGLQEERTTRFTYDLLNRQTAQLGQAISIYTVAGGDQSNQTPKETRAYDAAGNLIEVKAADGGRTLTYYDQLDRKIAELSPVGTLTTYAYDAAGNVLTQRIYGDTVPLPTTAGGTLSVPVTTNYRETTFKYDARNSQSEQIVSNVTVYTKDTGATTQNLSTKTYTDANGNVIKVIDARGNATYSFYDKAGNKTLQVDAELYVTKWDYDGAGNAIRQTQYDTKLNTAAFKTRVGVDFSEAAKQSDIEAVVTDAGDSRITEYTFDKLNHLTSESRLGVNWTSIDADSGDYTLHTSTNDTADNLKATTRYTYNGLGLVQTKTDAEGAVTTMLYDTLGRLKTTKAPSYQGYIDGSTPSIGLVTPTTDTEYTGLGLKARDIQRGTSDTVETDDRITVYSYDKNGMLTREKRDLDSSASRYTVTNYQYDLAGHITRKTQDRTDADGKVYNDRTSYTYDLAGRETQQNLESKLSTDTDWTNKGVQSLETAYNANGQINAKGTNGGWQEKVEYDQAGRVWRSNSGTENGAVNLYYYDENGNTTYKITSAVWDLGSASVLPDASLGSLNALLQRTDVYAATTKYDRLNRRTSVAEPKASTTSYAAQSSQQSTVLTTPDPFSAPALKPLNALSNVTSNYTLAWISRAGGANLTYNVAVPLPVETIYGTGRYRVSTQMTINGYTPTKGGYYKHINTGGSNNFYDPGTASISVTVYTPNSSSTGAEEIFDYSVTTEVYQQTLYGEVKILSFVETKAYTDLGARVPADPAPVKTQTSYVGQKVKINGVPLDTTSVKVIVQKSGETTPQEITATPLLINGSPIAGSYVFDWGSLTGSFTYQIEARSGEGKLLYKGDGTLTLSGQPSSTSNLHYVNWSISESTTQVEISQQYSYTAFGEVATQTDAKGNTTLFEYSKAGNLVKKTEPGIKVNLGSSETLTPATPITEYFFDRDGRQVATKDANGNVNTMAVLAISSTAQSIVAAEFHADRRRVQVSTNKYAAREGVKRNYYDVFGDLRKSDNELWDGLSADTAYATTYKYDEQGHVISVDRPDNADESYEYDEAGNRIANTLAPDKNSIRHREKTYFDALGRVTQTINAAGRTTSYDYQWVSTIAGGGGWRKTTSTNVDTRTLIDDTDVFGHLRWHKDEGNHVITYTYNQAGLLIRQTSLTTDAMPQNLTIAGGAVYSKQDISYEYYENGLTKSVIDNATKTWTKYRYDENGNRVFEGYARNFGTDGSPVWEYYQYSQAEYDAAGRLIRVVDPKSEIKYDYDAVGNRIRVWSRYHDGVGGGEQIQDYWYRYDNMNRFLVTMGKLDTSANMVRAAGTTDGRDITYNRLGQRTSVTPGTVNAQTTYFKYTNAGFMEAASYSSTDFSDTSTSLIAKRTYDGRGNVLSLKERLTTGKIDEHQYTYYADNRVDTDKEYIDGVQQSTATTTYLSTYSEDVYRLTITGVAQGVLSYYTQYDYEYWDGTKKNNITSVTSENKPRRGDAQLIYDENGHVRRFYDRVDNQWYYYTNDADGRIIRREEIDGPNNDPHRNNRVAQETTFKFENYYFFNGRQIGNVAYMDTPVTPRDYAQELVNRADTSTRRPVSSADFDQNYQAINSSYPGRTASNYTVASDGETLQSIAQAMWGDATMWYLIADGNGIVGTPSLKTGERLIIPNKVTNIHNNYSTSRPYDASEALGDINPLLPNPPPPPKKGCGGVGMILMVVVAVVATVLTAGAAALAMAGTLGSTFAAGGLAAVAGAASSAGLVAAAIGGAVGSIASQLVGMATGDVQKFSWSSVAQGAISGAVSAGMPSIGSGWTGAAMTAAASNVVTQGISMAVGLQKKFDWRGVAASAAGGALKYGIGKGLDSVGMKAGSFGNDLVRSAVSGIASGAARSAIFQQRPDWSAIAINSFGQALGDAIVGSITRGDGKKSASYGAKDAARSVAENMRKSGALTPDQTSSLSQLENDIQSGKRSLSFDVVDKIEGPGNTLANAQYQSGTDRALMSRAMVEGANGSASGSAALFAASYEETAEWMAAQIGLKLDNGLGGQADVGALFGKIGLQQLSRAMSGANASGLNFDFNVDGEARTFSTDAQSLDAVDRTVFTMERILRGDANAAGPFQSPAFLGGTTPGWNKNLSQKQEDRIVEAICECRKPSFRTPSLTQINLGVDLAGDFLRGTTDPNEEHAWGPNRINTRQACFNSFFMESGSDWYGYTPSDPQLRPEVTYRRAPDGSTTEPVLSSGRFDEYGNSEPGSIQRGLAVGRADGKGTTVRWDMTMLSDPSKGVVWSNVSDLFEVKFAGDNFTPTQDRKRFEPQIASKLRVIDAESFASTCEARERDSQRQTNRAVENTVTALSILMGMRGGRGGGSLGGRGGLAGGY